MFARSWLSGLCRLSGRVEQRMILRPPRPRDRGMRPVKPPPKRWRNTAGRSQPPLAPTAGPRTTRLHRTRYSATSSGSIVIFPPLGPTRRCESWGACALAERIHGVSGEPQQRRRPRGRSRPGLLARWRQQQPELPHLPVVAEPDAPMAALHSAAMVAARARRSAAFAPSPAALATLVDRHKRTFTHRPCPPSRPPHRGWMRDTTRSDRSILCPRDPPPASHNTPSSRGDRRRASPSAPRPRPSRPRSPPAAVSRWPRRRHRRCNASILDSQDRFRPRMHQSSRDAAPPRRSCPVLPAAPPAPPGRADSMGDGVGDATPILTHGLLGQIPRIRRPWPPRPPGDPPSASRSTAGSAGVEGRRIAALAARVR